MTFRVFALRVVTHQIIWLCGNTLQEREKPRMSIV